MFIYKNEITCIKVYLRTILKAAMSEDYAYLADFVSLIEEDLNLHRAGKALLFSIIDYLVNCHEK